MRLTLCRAVGIPRWELLRYARCPNETGLAEDVDTAIAALRRVWTPNAAAVQFPLRRQADGRLYMGPLLLPGKSIARHLADCQTCWLLGVTLGFGVDRSIAAAGQVSPSQSLLLDAAATAAIEDLANAACETLAAEGGPLTGRFSAGYGDLPLELQPALVDLLQGRRVLGLTTGPSLLLSPIKSVTALVGVREMEERHG